MWVVGVAALFFVAAGVTWFITKAVSGDGSEAATNVQEATSTTAPADEFIAALVETFTLTPGEARCVRDRSAGRLSEARISTLIAAPEPDGLDQVALDEILGACSLGGAGEAGEPTNAIEGEPFSFGDDSELDRLWTECSASGRAVCDELFNRAPEGSEYEAFADTCGGRGAPQVACAPDALAQPGATTLPGNADPRNYGDDATFDQLHDECAAGDAQACLTLTFQAPAGSAYAEFGRTCGNRPDDDRCAGG